MTLKEKQKNTVSRKEVAKRLHTTYHAVAMRDHRRPNDLKAFKLNGRIRYDSESIEQYILNQKKR